MGEKGPEGIIIENEPIIIDPYETMPHSSFLEQMGHLNDLLDQRNPQEVLGAFRDNPLLARTAIIEKGDNLSHLDSIQEAADILLREKYGSDVHIGNIVTSQMNNPTASGWGITCLRWFV